MRNTYLEPCFLFPDEIRVYLSYDLFLHVLAGGDFNIIFQILKKQCFFLENNNL